MNVLFIGGTGTISMAITKRLAAEGHQLFLLNRGNRSVQLSDNVKFIRVNDVNDEAEVKAKIAGMKFDVVCDFIIFHKEQAERDFRLFSGITNQFIFISSASAYHKPLASYLITEGTTLANPYWQYSREKIECEEFFLDQYRQTGFPITIVRPSHTYDERSVPLGVHGDKGSWQVVKRMLEGKPVIIQGDGTSLWTMTHNSDFAKAFVGLMGNPHAIGEAFQITSDETLTWNQIYKSIAQALGVELKPYYVSSEFLAEVGHYDLLGSLIGDKSNSVVFDNTKLKRAVPDYVTSVPFSKGVKQTIDYVLAHPECQCPDPEFDLWCDSIIDSLEKTKKELKKLSL